MSLLSLSPSGPVIMSIVLNDNEANHKVYSVM